MELKSTEAGVVEIHLASADYLHVMGIVRWAVPFFVLR